jgi:hypothetical protein
VTREVVGVFVCVAPLQRGDNENEFFDNKATLVQIFAVKGKKAKLQVSLLSHWNLSNKMAKTRAHNGVDDVSMGACGCTSA